MDRSSTRRLSVVAPVDELGQSIKEVLHSRCSPGQVDQDLTDLLQGAYHLDLTGEVNVIVDEVWDLGAWVEALPDPHVLVWREESSEDRYVHVSSENYQSPIRGRVSVCWRCEGEHAFWRALLLNEDLTSGEERALAPQRVVSAVAQLSILHAPE